MLWVYLSLSSCSLSRRIRFVFALGRRLDQRRQGLLQLGHELVFSLHHLRFGSQETSWHPMARGKSRSRWCVDTRVSINGGSMGIPPNGWFIMADTIEIIQMDDLGTPQCQETPWKFSWQRSISPSAMPKAQSPRQYLGPVTAPKDKDPCTCIYRIISDVPPVLMHIIHLPADSRLFVNHCAEELWHDLWNQNMSGIQHGQNDIKHISGHAFYHVELICWVKWRDIRSWMQSSIYQSAMECKCSADKPISTVLRVLREHPAAERLPSFEASQLKWLPDSVRDCNLLDFLNMFNVQMSNSNKQKRWHRI